ncbi:MAG: hypothetical protein AAF197_07850 [Pseudomonadota bacterium]
MDKQKRQFLSRVGVAASVAAVVVPNQWSKPVINAVVLPAHAQTSLCVTDSTVGGPLVGNPYGATTCQSACEQEAAANGAQLCMVTETLDSSSATICNCDIDLP